MPSDKNETLKLYISMGLVVFLLFGLCFAGFFFLFGGNAKITGFVVADNLNNPLSLKLSVNDYSIGKPIEGKLLVSAGSFSEDLKLLVFVDYSQVSEFSIKDLFDSHKVNYVIKGGKLVSSNDLSVNILEWNILTNYDYGIYKLKAKFSDGSFEDSANFDVIS